MSEEFFRAMNFGPGPACIPLECLKTAASELTNWKNTGMSVAEVSHRGKHFQDELLEISNRLRSILSVPSEFEILFLAGGASLQFSAVPFNLLGDFKNVDYLVTGIWSKKAYEECKRLNFPGVNVNLVNPLPSNLPTEIPDSSNYKLSDDAAYVYMCDNETIQGIEFSDLPDVSAPLVIDMSSNFLSKPITQWNKIGLILACAQKNFGISGVTVVIVRKSLLERPLKPFCPITLDYRTQVKNGCLYNTPPSFAIYFAGLEFKWIEEIGGVEYLEKRNKSRAKKLYKAIDESDLFVNVVKPQFRSSMNVPFYRKEGLLYKNDSLDLQFLDFLAERNIVNIGGHATVGGFRASIYNAVSDDAIDALIKAIQEFPGFNIIE